MLDNLGLYTGIAFVIILLGLAWYASKKGEEKRVNEIQAHSGEWGDEMCQWLIQNKYRATDPRTIAIMNKYQEWGKETCQKILQSKFSIGDTDEMVSLALGKPSSIDEQTITEKDVKFRWIYGTPRQGATYIWFKNGKVTKIKQ